MEDFKPDEDIQKRPGIFIIGSPNVGKRTLISRLLSTDFEDALDSSSELFVQGWTIDTKYYSADVAVWMAHLHDGFSFGSMPSPAQISALVMVFDMSQLASLAALKKWVSHSDIQRFDILLCIGNKVDLVPVHPVHNEYRRRLQRHENSIVRSDADVSEYGLSETDGSNLLGNYEPSCDIRTSCLEWCMEQNIEYVDACASNVDFDKCLSVDGDSQGIERLFGALSAHMWPGMVLKSGNRIPTPILPATQDSSEEDSDYEADYEILSKGSVEDLWDDTEEGWVSAPPDPCASSSSAGLAEREVENVGLGECEEDDVYHGDEVDKSANLQVEDLDQLMSEIANVRSSSRLMPDFQRRDTAAKLAMRMAAMFGDSSGDEGLSNYKDQLFV